MVYFAFLASFTPSHSLPYAFDVVRVIAAIFGFIHFLYIALDMKPDRIWNRTFVVLVLLIFGSYFWSIDRSYTLKYIIAMLPFLGTFISVTNVCRSEEDFLQWRHFYFIMLTFSALYTLLLCYSYGSVRVPGELKAISVDITFDLIVCLPIIVHSMLWAKTTGLRIVYLCCFLLGVIALILTQSRGGLLAVFAGGLLAAYLLFIDSGTRIMNRRGALLIALGAVALVGVLIVVCWEFIFTQQLKDKFLMRMMIISPDAEVREEYLRMHDERLVALYDMYRQLLRHWDLGIGFGAFPAVSTNAVIVHNFILDMWVSAGVIGLIAGICLILFTWLRFYKDGRRRIRQGDGYGGYFRIALSIAFFVFCIDAMFQHVWFFNHLYIFLGLSQWNRKLMVTV